jgi:hypothetical protein
MSESFKCQDCGAPVEQCWCNDDGYDNSGCYECGGRGYFVDCIDDLCHGGDECIHGDPPRPCRTCNPKGEREDAYF